MIFDPDAGGLAVPPPSKIGPKLNDTLRLGIEVMTVLSAWGQDKTIRTTRLEFCSSSAASPNSGQVTAKFAKSDRPPKLGWRDHALLLRRHRSQDLLGFLPKGLAGNSQLKSSTSNIGHGAHPREMIGSVGDRASTSPPPPLGGMGAHAPGTAL
ncbi:hypothetical protein J7T55_006127 [Diaporthe amygdali]|uniref:uncharacterized protein n=1 Tax=Phomopsis amygdali TaxID=1214568 RepID=UPI0022FEA74B|nr:uncharacterized protein J7T55_006127 [Diaporthe amygdali]KAJ0124786.1 hypothetical protein J7T55_006127 [Diaporthe amygdali]